LYRSISHSFSFADDKVQILSALVHQLIGSFTIGRDLIEENYDKGKLNQKSLRDHQVATGRREREREHYW